MNMKREEMLNPMQMKQIELLSTPSWKKWSWNMRLMRLQCICLVALVAALFVPTTVFAQCAVWNTALDTIEQPPGNVIGEVSLDGRVAVVDANANPPTRLGSQGVQCVERDGELFSPDDLTTPIEEEEEEEEENNNDLPAICGIAPGLAICQRPTDGGGGGGGGGQPGGGNDTIKTNPADEGGGGEGGDGDGAQVGGSVADDNRCDDNNRNCRDKTIGTAMSHDLMNQFGRTPLLIDRRDVEKGPLNMVSEDSAQEKGGNRPNLGKVFGYDTHTKVPDAESLTTDDEVLRTAMASYQPIRRMRMDFLNDENSRDLYLDSALTLRGVSIMAMGFLDKTLGAGLHAIDQQANASIQSSLQKQVLWTTTRMSNDDRAQVMRDVDEKIEACLESALQSQQGVAQKTISGSGARKWVQYECSDECGNQPTGGGNRYQGDSATLDNAGNGTYEYCVCCAESDLKLNKLNVGNRQPVGLDSQPDELWTLAERAFYGVSDDESESKLKSRVKEFKLLFGDVVLKGATEGGGTGTFHYATQMPKASPQKIVSMYKNRCYHSGGPAAADLKEHGTDCHLEEETRFKVKCGICPSLMLIMENWDKILKKEPVNTECGDKDRLWMEASFGHPINGRDIKQFLAINGDPSANLDSGEEKELGARVIESWCEASAIAAASRLYAMKKAASVDHVILTNHLTETEKAQFLRLVNRYGEYLAMAQLDANSKLATTALATGASILYDRGRLGYSMSAMAKAHTQSVNAAQSGHMQGWGASSQVNVQSGGQ